MRKILLSIRGMECPNCSMTLERIEDTLTGIFSAEASYQKAQMVVEYDEEALSLDQIVDEVKRLGYEVNQVISK